MMKVQKLWVDLKVVSSGKSFHYDQKFEGLSTTHNFFGLVSNFWVVIYGQTKPTLAFGVRLWFGKRLSSLSGLYYNLSCFEKHVFDIFLQLFNDRVVFTNRRWTHSEKKRRKKINLWWWLFCLTRLVLDDQFIMTSIFEMFGYSIVLV